MKVMIVDDEQDVQILFQQQFRKEIRNNQIQLCFASSAENALEQLQTATCLALILADINMPGMTGLELLKIIKTHLPHLKVFITTAYGDDRNYQIAIENGADDYIEKPVKFDSLKEKIWRALADFHLHSAERSPC